MWKKYPETPLKYADFLHIRHDEVRISFWLMFFLKNFIFSVIIHKTDYAGAFQNMQMVEKRNSLDKFARIC